MSHVAHLAGQTWHGRKGAIANGFRYGIDYLYFDAEKSRSQSWLFGRNRWGIFSVRDLDHGGSVRHGSGPAWVREVLRDHNLPQAAHIYLLAQPRFLGYVFNPVSFWFCKQSDGGIFAVIAEVTNTYKDRHSYLCYHEDMRPILATDRLDARKLLHVSPFQEVAGQYRFRFDIRADKLGVWIDHTRGTEGVFATLTGALAPLCWKSALRAMWRHPFAARRVMGLIHWQAFKLWRKGALFRERPIPPDRDVS